MRLIFLFQAEADRGFMVIMIFILVFFIFILPLLNETIVISRKNALVSTMTLCIKVVINMEDKMSFKS